MTEQLIVHLIAIVVAGLVAGFAGGLFGIGGGAILVPTFLALFPHMGVSQDVVMHSAVGTCLALVVPAAIMATKTHYKLGNLDARMLRSWMPWILLGTVTGALTIQLLRTHDLQVIFTLYLFASAIYVAVKSASETRGEGEPPSSVKVGGGFVIGMLSVWLGLGGGTFTVPYLCAFHYPIKKSIAISSATGIVIGTGGAIGAAIHGWGAPGLAPYSLGYINGIAFAVIAPLVMAIAPLGSKTASKAPERLLKWIYVALLATISCYMAYRTFF
ncbi:sulfite exporter TauE/SafE family protein [Bythopirellula polymerisocia]|uniref:Probable membrane transporter protein n=1 Tax=Bythopirellula polymerisocia TaxID=2528003 RepID=A0A5C6CDX2_9BACT|nr:sulfite exporter TauE/SafE family protein [Bythopirellula polymerisocia]TWU21957.1 Sulfite exporter TauE/SafE [Bythopirellula polymerisocia]